MKILLFGYINTNVIDGSSFFLTSMAKMLTSRYGVHVDLLLATPVQRTVVLADILRNPSVTVIDPFSDGSCPEAAALLGESRYMSDALAGDVVAAYWNSGDYDSLIVRGTETAARVGRVDQTILKHMATYVTGVTDESRPIPELLRRDLEYLQSGGGVLFCQTDEMRSHILKVPELAKEPQNVLTLNPIVEVQTSDFAEVFRSKSRYSRFIYTGKFARDWNPVQILAGFAEVRQDGADIRLDVAGDQFKADSDRTLFIPEVKYLLANTEGATWHGGVTRHQSRNLISSADVGIGWRGNALDTSLELSTKLLEYGALGRPCIMNRTRMHERLFGADYPLFANSMGEFVELLRKIPQAPDVVQEAGVRSFEAAQDFSYDSAFIRVIEPLFRISRRKSASLVANHSEDAVIGSVLRTRSMQWVGSDCFALPNHDTVSDLLASLSERGVISNYNWLGPVLKISIEPRAEFSGAFRINAGSAIVSELLNLGSMTRHVAGPETIEDNHDVLVEDDAFASGDLPAQLRRSRRESRELRRRVHSLEASLTRLSSRLNTSQSQLTRLRNSKFGSLQVGYWKWRSRA